MRDTTFMLLLFLLTITGFHPCSGCIQSERDGLLKFKQNLTDTSNRLASWVENGDCCKWYGIVCHNLTGHVLQLQLSPDFNETEFGGEVSESLLDLKHLEYLDLSNNYFGGSPIPEFLGSIRSLKHLNLPGAGFGGLIPSQLGNLSNLQYLDLGLNNLVGKIPKSFKNLCNLRSINLQGNKIGQEINEIFEILSPCISNVLDELILIECGLSGYIPNHLEKFQNLALLSLSSNSIASPIPISVGNLKSINILDLSMNKLNGTLPLGFGGLTKLEEVDLSHNALNGDVSEIHFENLTNLQSFHASENKFRLKVGSNWKPPRSLTSLNLCGWSIGPQFPYWIQSQNQIEDLNLAYSGIVSPSPAWFWDMSLSFSYLNISHNQIRGVIPNKPSFEYFHNEAVVDLSSNNFGGPLPYMFSDIGGLFLSNNSFTGPLSKFLCHKMHNPSYLEVLDIGNNQLSGEIPDCWMKWDSLLFINLNNNKLSGKIPLSIGALTGLDSLHLRNNSISGEIPLSLRNCTELTTVDFGENELVGNIPSWFGETFQNMAFLSLRRNKFDGHVPEELCGMISLRILDLSDNNLFGGIPKCLYNFSEMVSGDDEGDYSSFYFLGSYGYVWSFFDSMSLVTKGKMNTYDTILFFVRALDFSKNKLSGQIPEEITSLEKLIYLNLSHNLLTGRIPTKIGDMQSLEVLDFSQNKLFGEIPQSLAKMTFLGTLNLSFNNFSGRIPLSTQIQGFPPSSFMGNEELCGPPLSKNCSGDGEAPGNASTERDDGGGHEINWLYVSMPLGFVVGFWATFGPLVLNRRWRGIYFHFLENLWDKIWLWWHLM